MARCPALLVVLPILVAAGPVAAGPLEDTLASVYLDNPRLAAGRAALRAVDEGVPLALALRRPSLTLRSTAGLQVQDSSRGREFFTPTRQSLDLSQSILSGGETTAAAARAENLVLAERARLGQIEEAVLLDTVAVFTAVARDQAVLDRARDNEHRLTEQLSATRDRLRFGDVSKTDVAQAEARRSGGEAERIAAEGAVETSVADYQHLVGEEPGRIELPEPAVEAEEGLDAVLPRAEDSFTLQAARFELALAEADIGSAKAAMRPHLSLDGELSYVDEPNAQVESRGGAQLSATLQVPLYEGGAEYARLRQSRELRGQRQSGLDEARRAATAAISAAFQDRRTATARIHALEQQADAAAFALDGVKQEALLGSRSVVEVLDAEAELYRDEVELIRARREAVLATYRLRAATGRLTAEALDLPVAAYDPAVHYRDVRNRWFGSGVVRSAR